MLHLIELVRLRGEIPFAYHYASSDVRELQEKHKKIMNKFPDSGISTHSLDTNNETWTSVVEMDPYFNDVNCIEDISTFGDYLSKLDVSSFDICSYILGHSDCDISFKKMEKLLYFAYSAFLEKTKRSLFPESFSAWEFGPVESQSRYARKEGRLPDLGKATDKIVFSADSSVILSTLDEIIRLYGNKSENELISMTHRKGSPWQRNYVKNRNIPIPDEDILKYHHVETINN